MTENQPSIRFISESLSRFQEFFITEQISFAYLFGSHARNQNNKMSDIAIAVFFPDSVANDQYLEKRLTLMTRLGSLLKNEVDILVLNDRYDELVLEVLKHGKLIFEQDAQARINFRHHFTRQYLDFLPYRESYFSHVISRLKTGALSDAKNKRYQDSIEKIRRMHFHSEKHQR